MEMNGSCKNGSKHSTTKVMVTNLIETECFMQHPYTGKRATRWAGVVYDFWKFITLYSYDTHYYL